jgi:hypothetical protein
MKREREEEMRSGRGTAPQIFFFDLNNLQGFTGILFILGVVAAFAVVFYALIQKVVEKPVDFNKQRKIEREQKKASNGKKT